MRNKIQLSRVSGIIQEGIEAGLHLGAQVYVYYRGEERMEVWGELRPGVAITPETLLLWLSATKPITAIAIAQLVEQGFLDLDRPIAQDLPEFGQYGKEHITLRHCLTHTGGFRTADAVSDQLPWDEMIAQICAVRPEPRWEPGEKAGYHTSGSWRILGELIRRVTSTMPNDFIRASVFEPLGMRKSWIGVPLSEQSRLDISPIYQTDKQPPSDSSYYNTPPAIAQCGPGTNGRGPAYELGLFYRMLLSGGTLGGKRIVSEETARTWTSPQRIGMFDQTFKHVVDWGYGFKLNSPQDVQRANPTHSAPYGFGEYASSRTFGHSGSQSSSAFADPKHNLVAVMILNGRPGETLHQARSRKLHNAVYEDLGIVKIE